MSHTRRDDAVASNTAAADTLLKLSSIYLQGVESLTSLNLNAAREVFETCVSATKPLSEAKSGQDYTKLLSELGQPMLEKAMSHSRNAYEILAKSQQELAAVFKEQFAHPQMSWPDWAGGNTLSEMFTKGLQQFTASAEDNFKAASDASSKVIATATANAKKIA